MTFENGGISDKQGNAYENRYLARVLIRLLAEEITLVVVEPVGKYTDVCEFYITEKDGRKIYYQCKGSNGTNDHWRPSDLQRYDLFSRVQKLLRSDPNCKFCFVSPLYYDGLDDLCNRTKRYPSAKDYLEHALSNEKLRKAFSACEKYFNLDRNDDGQLNELVSLLSRCEFIVQPNNSETVQDLDRWISVYFWGVPGNTRVLLENYVNDTASYGRELTASDVLNYVSSKGVGQQLRLADTRIIPAITRLNNSFSEAYKAIRGSLFHRDCTDLLIKEIKAGKSIVLHGKAGTGKSGCIRELVGYLEQNHIDYLAIQLDKHIPNDYADKYGETLGLPGSPVISLSQIAGSKPCVLILDQLDALRWTTLHSSTALLVCKEIISQARGINEHANGHISIVFSVRSFDYENDTGIQSLFVQEKQDKTESPWSVIRIESLTDDEVTRIIGDEYKQLPCRIKELIRIPSSLYVWLKINPNRRTNQIKSAQEMVSSWWCQIQDNYSATGNSRSSLADCINDLVAAIIRTSSFALPQAMLLRYVHEVEYLVSGGMLVRENNRISFVHQSFLDSFLLEKDLIEIFSSQQSLLSLVLSWETQMPIYRYRLSALLQSIVETDQSLFTALASEFLKSDEVHFYYKVAVFEVIGQLAAPSSAIYRLVDEYFEKGEWHRIIIQTVYERHPVFIKHLSDLQCFDWLGEEGRSLLISMKYYDPDFVEAVLRKWMESGAVSSKMILSILDTDIDGETEGLFAIRMGIYRNDVSLVSGIGFINLDRAKAEHVIQVLALVLSNIEVLGTIHVYIDDKKRLQFCEENHSGIIHALLDVLCNSAKKTPLSFHATLKYNDRFWLPREHELSMAREAVEFVKAALKALVAVDPEDALRYISSAGLYKNGISNEIALSTLLALPVEYSDAAIEWLLADFDNHILDCISNEYDYLSTCKDILKKHSSSCSKELFTQLENRICNWKGDREWFVNSYKHRIEINRSKEQGYAYWPAWGHLQKALLPFLDSTRITQRTKELIMVLNRNNWVLPNRYHGFYLSGPARPVVSTIHNSAARLSDKTWLNIIINTNVDESHSGMREKDDGEYYYESSHWSFAQDLGSCVKNNPTRYARLLLKFPHDCFPGYYSSVLYGLRNPELQAIDFDLLCDVIRYSRNIMFDSVPMAIAHIIRERPEENWPKDIIDYLIEISTGNLRPIGNERIIISQDNDPFPTLRDIAMSVLNCPRGAAVNAIGELLSYHSILVETFEPVMEKLAQDESDIIRFALVKCIVALYEHDPAFSRGIFDIVIEKAPIAWCTPNSFWLMSRDLQALEEYYFPYLKKASDAPNPELVTRVARLICATAIITSSEQVLSFLYSHPWSKEAMDKICLEAASTFDNEEYRMTSQRIIEHLLEIDANSLHSINQLFQEKRLDLRRDKSFITAILKKRHDIETTNDFIEFIKTQDTEISGFAETIKTAVQSFDEKAHTWQKRQIEDGLVHAVIKLIDTANGDKELKECCLDILEKKKKKRILTDSAVSKLIEGVD